MEHGIASTQRKITQHLRILIFMWLALLMQGLLRCTVRVKIRFVRLFRCTCSIPCPKPDSTKVDPQAMG